VNKGISKVEFILQRDCFEPHEIIPIVLKLNNSRCDLSIKRYKVKLWREIRATSINGTAFVDKSEMIKRKYEEVVPANDSSQRQVEIGLKQIKIHDEHLEMFKAKKPARY
jgi:hypothetical protein